MTATAKAQAMERVFRFASLELADPDPQASPEDALALWESEHPLLSQVSLSAPEFEGNKMAYTVIKPKGETKG